jgi:hypothetical protein
LPEPHPRLSMFEISNIYVVNALRLALRMTAPEELRCS